MRSKPFAVLGILTVGLTLSVVAQEVRSTPGPLEKAANPITAENPIPRRIFSVAPAYPAEARALEATALVTMRLTLDRSGRIAEIRSPSNPFVNVGPGAPSSPAALQSVGEALIRSAASALSQWQYDAPANGPISFNVVFNFRSGSETTSAQDARTLPQPPPGFGAAPPPTTPWPAAAGAVRVGGNVKAPTQTRRVNPVYPAIAQSARVQGVVILEALIGEDGRVRDTRVLRSIPLLDQAALDAVRQWEYQPTLLNGAVVPTVMTVTVQFTMPEPPPPPPPPPPQ
jgi:TonB family protein